MAVNRNLNGDQSFKNYEALAWLNETLQTSFTKLEQLCTGEAHCQLMEQLFPGSLDLSKVRFQVTDDVDCIHNYSLLQGAFRKVGIVRHIPMEELIKRNTIVAFTFLQWFQNFFTGNKKGQKHNPSHVKGGQNTLPGETMVEVTMEEKMETTVKEECVKSQRTEQAKAAGSRFDSSNTSLRLIRKYSNFITNTDAQASAILSPNSLSDTIQACLRVPYCLYLFVGVELDAGQSTSVVLIGYHDQNSGIGAVRLLDTLQMSVDTVDLQTSADITVIQTSDSDARLLIQTLKKFGLSLSNISVFYCDAPHPGVSQVFVSQLQAFNPRLVSLCGLPGMVGRACQAGLLASFSCVVDLIKDIHRHYSTCLSVDNSLKVLFTGFHCFNPSRSISAQYLFIVCTVQNMVNSWRDLVEYFKSLKQAEDAERIRAQLMDAKVKLHFLFLSHALEPLRALQQLQQHGTADVAVELQLISMLVNSYAASILRPSVAERFLRKRDVALLRNQKELLPMTEVDIGSRAMDFLWATAVVDLGEQERDDFMKDAVDFYKAALQSLVESIPEHLGDVALRNIGTVLKHPENINGNELSKHVLSELGVQLGVCSYLVFTKAEKQEQERGTGEKRSWAKVLNGSRPNSTLHRLFLSLLALPSSLHRKDVFAKVSQQNSSYNRRHNEESSSDNSGDESAVKPSLQLPPHHRDNEDSDYTDNSSDVVDMTEESQLSGTSRLIKSGTKKTPTSVYIVCSDDDDDDDDDDDNVKMVSTVTPTNSTGQKVKFNDRQGELIWVQVQGFALWPAVIVPCRGQLQIPGSRMVSWFGQTVSSQVSEETMKPFADFTECFCTKSFAVLETYREAIFLALEEAALRCNKMFSVNREDKEELLKKMLDWAFKGFKPTGPDGLNQVASSNGVTKTNRPNAKKKLFPKAAFPPSSSSMSSKSNMSVELKEMNVSLNKLSCNSVEKSSHKSGGGRTSAWEEPSDLGKGVKGGWGKGKSKGGWKGGKGVKKKSSLFDGFDDDTSPNYVPNKKRAYAKIYNKVNEPAGVYKQPDQKLREETIRRIMDMKLDIEGFCLCCGTETVDIFHPLFKGSLCLTCKYNFTETLHRYDEDGYQSYCTICCYGMEVILCGNNSCCRSYCEDCLNILVAPGTFAALKELDPWICFICQPHRAHGALIPREDWSIRVQGFFTNNSGMEFEPHRVYPSITANLRRPLRVLSLFDGIATGYLVLKELGFKVEKYFASEICEDSIAVATVNHDAKIIQVGDSRFITQEHLDQWGPFDLLIGGSPCNDLSIVNPFRKGLYEGTGRLFFEYYRILQLLKPEEGDSRPFFWLFENVVFMNTCDKVNICRFLECNPVMVDAVKVSPAHRARCFWGNIPGMSRPIIASQNDKLTLQDCLEIGREARVTKVRTITTNPNSLKQGKDVSQLPVLQNGKDDNLWITELEKIFGFPKHYTDVRNMNRQQRQKVLGKAWSVPVIRHLFAPLKDYFACEELLPLTVSNTSTSASVTLSSITSTSPFSPASPEVQQLR
ncbi:uncharacterized protein LOC128357722 [Scomber scombrus]|uniref:DNA (cytosine-5-)-methyltransferase n=1 Tax=Scomber scombrus TaxID=13677 RepID=A0AAV1Q1C6_SCOSC